MALAEHWHGYAWIGQSRPEDKVRRDPENATPPLQIADWLEKDAKRVAQTFAIDRTGTAAASAWMREGGVQHPRLQEKSFPLDERMEYVDECLGRGVDVVWGYYSQQASYVSRSLITCPRPGIDCPLRRPARRTAKAA